ncbi:MAG: hypothetical protein AAFQ07_02750 [Chloroflexota bacterium]
MREVIALFVSTMLSFVLSIGTVFAGNGFVGIVEQYEDTSLVPLDEELFDGGTWVIDVVDTVGNGDSLVDSVTIFELDLNLDHWLKQCHLVNSDGLASFDCCASAYCLPPMYFTDGANFTLSDDVYGSDFMNILERVSGGSTGGLNFDILRRLNQ